MAADTTTTADEAASGGDNTTPDAGGSDSSENNEQSFQDLVVKFSNLRTLLEPGGGKYGNAFPSDICHKIGNMDYAVIIGVSTQDYLPTSSNGIPPENDARIMSDICKMHLGIKPSRVKLLTSHTKKPTRSNIRKALLEGFKSVDKDDLMLVYFSGHGFSKRDDHYLIPQDFRTEDLKGTGISARSMYKWMETSKCHKIVFILDCCYAELFTEALYRVRGSSGVCSDKNLYLLASSEVDEPTVSDETWLEHGYMTFFIKHFFNFVCDTEQQLSMRKMCRFVKKYSEPLSRFTYTVYDGQVTQIPVLAHLGPENLVETDGLGPAKIPPRMDMVKEWRRRITESTAYSSWWQERLADAKVILGDALFSYSRIYFVLFLNGLHSLCILLCEQDSFHHDLEDTESYDAFSSALVALIDEDLSSLTHPSYERYHPGEGISNPLSVIRGGVSEGIRSVSQATAPQEEFVCTETLSV